MSVNPNPKLHTTAIVLSYRDFEAIPPQTRPTDGVFPLISKIHGYYTVFAACVLGTSIECYILS